ncbi:MAG: alpha/beta fold hydrolase [Phycisphaerales bacterium]
MLQAALEEYVTFTSGAIRLRGILSYPEQDDPKHAVLLCSPHPHFAGDMHNNVVCAIARRLAARCAVLRFDYRGVGDSEIALPAGISAFDYWTEIEETRDYRDAVEDVTAAARTLLTATDSFGLGLSVVGYSFGAVTGMLFAHRESCVQKMVAVAPPLGKVSFAFLSDCPKASLHLVGKRDFLYSDERMAEFRQSIGPAATVTVLDEADHFFRGEEDSVARQIEEYILGIEGNEHGS